MASPQWKGGWIKRPFWGRLLTGKFGAASMRSRPFAPPSRDRQLATRPGRRRLDDERPVQRNSVIQLIEAGHPLIAVCEPSRGALRSGLLHELRSVDNLFGVGEPLGGGVGERALAHQIGAAARQLGASAMLAFVF